MRLLPNNQENWKDKGLSCFKWQKLNTGYLLALALFYKSLQKLHLSNIGGENKLLTSQNLIKKSRPLGVLSCIIKDLRTVISDMQLQIGVSSPLDPTAAFE